MLTLEKLWKALKPSGIYIIEDIETSYWGKSNLYGYKFNSNRDNIIRPFKKIIDVINFEFSKKKTMNKHLKKVAEEIEMITFAHNCIVLVKKDYDSFSNYYDREYLLEESINYNSFRKLPKRIINRLRRQFNL